jgi:undecaprenyl-diphosphatase
MDFLSAIIMGIIEGLTEFLPVSSTGHMILTADLLNLNTDSESVKTFEVVVQLGAVLAVVVLYFGKFLSLFDFRKHTLQSLKPRLNLLHIIIAMIPASLLGVLLRDFIKEYLFGPQTVVYSLIAGGLLMIAAEKFHPRATAETVDEITYKQAFIIGIFQILALWPGFSRSGSTISGGLFARVSSTAAAEFTFLVSVPIMLGATVVDMYKSAGHLSSSDFTVFAVGFITAFIVGMLAIKTFLGLLKRLSLTSFAIYRFVLAAVFFFIVL